MDSIQLLNEIREAWGDCPMPDAVTDSHPRFDEEKELWEVFDGKNWQTIALNDIKFNFSKVFFFSADAFAYYLAAYMSYIITDFDKMDLLTDAVVEMLVPPDRADYEKPNGKYANHKHDLEHHFTVRKQQFDNRISRLTDVQKKAVGNFMIYLERRYKDEYPWDEPSVALRRYWGKFVD